VRDLSPASEPVAAGARIEALQAELAALRAEMQAFAYAVSHDLRADVRHILAYTQLVQEEAAPLLNAEVRGFLDTITGSARHLGALIDALQELARLDTVPAMPAAVALDALVGEVVAQQVQALAAQHPGRGVQWQVEAGLPVVLADGILLRQALQEVLDNAVKFTAHRDPAVVSVRCRAQGSAIAGNEVVGDGAAPAGSDVQPGGPWVVLEISDNGAGFNPAQQHRLFTPLSRLHPASKFAGLGMGLARVRKICNRLGAQASATGQVDGGCTVRLALPACQNA